jgi:hypothetical protein
MRDFIGAAHSLQRFAAMWSLDEGSDAEPASDRVIKRWKATPAPGLHSRS